MIKQILKRYGYEPIKPSPPLRCASIVVRQDDKPDCPPINLCENDTLNIDYDITITSSKEVGSNYCYIHLNGVLVGEIIGGGVLDVRRSILVKWDKNPEIKPDKFTVHLNDFDDMQE